MTPIQVIMLTARMRKAQQAFRKALAGDGGLGKVHAIMCQLEDQLDAAIQPYLDHVNNTGEAANEQ